MAIPDYQTFMLPVLKLLADGTPQRRPSIVAAAADNVAPVGGVLSLFPAYAQAIHDCREYWNRHEAATHSNEALLGIGFEGPKRWVSRSTGSLPLWR